MDKYNHWLGILVREFQNNDREWAIVIGQTAYYSCSKVIVDIFPHWRAHENQHKVQWSREGWKFPFKYLWYNIRYGYKNNPYELEAIEASKKI